MSHESDGYRGAVGGIMDLLLPEISEPSVSDEADVVFRDAREARRIALLGQRGELISHRSRFESLIPRLRKLKSKLLSLQVKDHEAWICRCCLEEAAMCWGLLRASETRREACYHVYAMGETLREAGQWLESVPRHPFWWLYSLLLRLFRSDPPDPSSRSSLKKMLAALEGGLAKLDANLRKHSSAQGILAELYALFALYAEAADKTAGIGVTNERLPDRLFETCDEPWSEEFLPCYLWNGDPNNYDPYAGDASDPGSESECVDSRGLAVITYYLWLTDCVGDPAVTTKERDQNPGYRLMCTVGFPPTAAFTQMDTEAEEPTSNDIYHTLEGWTAYDVAANVFDATRDVGRDGGYAPNVSTVAVGKTSVTISTGPSCTLSMATREFVLEPRESTVLLFCTDIDYISTSSSSATVTITSDDGASPINAGIGESVTRNPYFSFYARTLVRASQFHRSICQVGLRGLRQALRAREEITWSIRVVSMPQDQSWIPEIGQFISSRALTELYRSVHRVRYALGQIDVEDQNTEESIVLSTESVFVGWSHRGLLSCSRGSLSHGDLWPSNVFLVEFGTCPDYEDDPSSSRTLLHTLPGCGKTHLVWAVAAPLGMPGSPQSKCATMACSVKVLPFACRLTLGNTRTESFHQIGDSIFMLLNRRSKTSPREHKGVRYPVRKGSRDWTFGGWCNDGRCGGVHLDDCRQHGKNCAADTGWTELADKYTLEFEAPRRTNQRKGGHLWRESDWDEQGRILFRNIPGADLHTAVSRSDAVNHVEFWNTRRHAAATRNVRLSKHEFSTRDYRRWRTTLQQANTDIMQPGLRLFRNRRDVGSWN